MVLRLIIFHMSLSPLRPGPHPSPEKVAVEYLDSLRLLTPDTAMTLILSSGTG
jgi:hypothetical protein